MREFPSLRIKGVSKVYPHLTLETPSILSSQEDAELLLECLQGGFYFSRQRYSSLDISGGSKSFLSLIGINLPHWTLNSGPKRVSFYNVSVLCLLILPDSCYYVPFLHAKPAFQLFQLGQT